MEFKIDLNKLSIKELKELIALQERTNSEEKKEKTPKPIKTEEEKFTDKVVPEEVKIKINRKKFKITTEIKNRLVELVTKSPKKYPINKLCEIARLSNGGSNYKYIVACLKKNNALQYVKGKYGKVKLTKEKSTKKYSYSDGSKKKSSERSRFIFSRANALMKKDNFDRAKAMSIASQEWETKKPFGRLVKPEEKNIDEKEDFSFDWRNISTLYGQEIKAMIYQGFKDKKKVSMLDFKEIFQAEDYEYYLLSQKILSFRSSILRDLNLKGDIRFNDGVLTWVN